MSRARCFVVGVVLAALGGTSFVWAGSYPTRARHGMVVSANQIASNIGASLLEAGGNAIDAAVATAFALAVTHPTAGNIGGGGFIIFRPRKGEPVAYDFREIAPDQANDKSWLDENGLYSKELHHQGHRAVGVPGTVAGLHMAWEDHGSWPWEQLIEPAIRLAREGFVVTDGLARSLEDVLGSMEKYPASVAQFSKGGEPYRMGDVLKQVDLSRTLVRIAEQGPAGFYEGETAELIDKEMFANGGLITRKDLKHYRAKRRVPIRGTYRGYEILSMPPPSSGGTTLVEMLNILEGFDIAAAGFGSAVNVHRMAEAMRRAYADRALYLGDPDFNPDMPIERLTSKGYAAELRATINESKASESSPDTFQWPIGGNETTHFSIVDRERNAVSLTYTLEYSYGSKIVVPGAGFLLNNEMGDFNAGLGLTDENGLIGTEANLVAPRKRMLSSMSPTIVVKDSELFMLTGTPGGRTIINTVLQTILNVVDHGMNAQEAVDAGRIHHQWLPDHIRYEKYGFSQDTLALLESMGHTLEQVTNQGAAGVIVFNLHEDLLEAGVDRRRADAGVGIH